MFDKIRTFFLSQLKQGIGPRELSLACAVGLTGSIFPAIGATTLLCFLGASYLRLNHALVQAVNYAVAPLQLILFPFYLKLGAWIVGVPAVSVDPRKVYDMFVEAPSLFFQEYGWAWAQGILAWAVTVPFLFFVVYRVVRPIFNRAASKQMA